MRKYLISENGTFRKANLHCHSTFSDGSKTPAELKELYMKMGYSVVAFTDHDIFIPHDELTDENFLALHGFEAEFYNETGMPFKKIKTCHLCFIALDPDNLCQPCWERSGKYVFGKALDHKDEVIFDEKEPDFIREYTGAGVSKMIKKAREKGFFVTYNHPTWSMESYPEYMAYEELNAMEIFNGACLSEGYQNYDARIYDDMIAAGKKIYCIGADDNHNLINPELTFGSGFAFTMIKTPSLNYRDVAKALENGDFYASEAPEIYELRYEDGYVHITCSPAARIDCIYGLRRVRTASAEYKNIPGGKVITENGFVTGASFDVQPDSVYFRITVTDKNGKHACTNAYFTEDLM